MIDKELQARLFTSYDQVMTSIAEFKAIVDLVDPSKLSPETLALHEHNKKLLADMLGPLRAMAKDLGRNADDDIEDGEMGGRYLARVDLELGGAE